VEVLLPHVRGEDEIVIQYDEPKAPPAILGYLNGLSAARKIAAAVPFALNDDFAGFKNNLRCFSRGDYIFHIDADEYPGERLLSEIHDILEPNPSVDVLVIPRVNTVAGLTAARAREWRWRVDAHGRVNFPDPQGRIYRNCDSIRWTNPVYEILVGDRIRAHLPFAPEFALIHPKTVERQERQKDLYERLTQTGTGQRPAGRPGIGYRMVRRPEGGGWRCEALPRPIAALRSLWSLRSRLPAAFSLRRRLRRLGGDPAPKAAGPGAGNSR
jgi:hypothetical protein